MGSPSVVDSAVNNICHWFLSGIHTPPQRTVNRTRGSILSSCGMCPQHPLLPLLLHSLDCYFNLLLYCSCLMTISTVRSPFLLPIWPPPEPAVKIGGKEQKRQLGEITHDLPVAEEILSKLLASNFLFPFGSGS